MLRVELEEKNNRFWSDRGEKAEGRSATGGFTTGRPLYTGSIIRAASVNQILIFAPSEERNLNKGSVKDLAQCS